MSDMNDKAIAATSASIEAWRTRARTHLDSLTKPLGSLGRLEDLAAQLVSIRQEHHTQPLRKAAYVFAADHGITAEGVSAYPSEVTRQMVLNFLSGGAAINVLTRLHHCALHVVDVGINADLEAAPGLLHHKIAHGSRNMLHEPAMTDDELDQAIDTGRRIALDAISKGYTLLAVGEMGIGNTSAASAITAILCSKDAAEVTGRGTGLDTAAHTHKCNVIRAVLAKHFPTANPKPTPHEILARVGGLEIAAMTGFILGAAQANTAILIDGFISTAAAAIACAINPAVRDFLFASHQSEEPGHAALLAHLNLVPILTLNMRLGEATGAVLAMPILESALALYNEMATFQSAGVSEAAR